MIKINKVNFQVIGVLPEKGGGGFRNQDDVVLVPVNTAMHRLMGKDYVDSIELEIRDAASLSPAQDEILDLMYRRKRVPMSQQDDAFQILNMSDIQSALSSSSKTMAGLLASIAAISLLVGGIGIMNIMLVSVSERTSEIGLRKALGARSGDVLLQFLVESLVLASLGGAIGTAMGIGAVSLVALLTPLPASISAGAVLVTVGLSGSIGLFFGVVPARRAANLDPIVALRSV